MEDELGKNFWLKTVGVVIGLGILGLISFFIFTGLIARFGAIAALVIISESSSRSRTAPTRSSSGANEERTRRRKLRPPKRRGSLAATAAEAKPVQAIRDEPGEPGLVPRVDEVSLPGVHAAGAQHDGPLRTG